MNEIINKSLLAEEKFMPEIHLRKPVFTYIAYRAFTKKKKSKYKNLKKHEIQNIFIKKNRTKLAFSMIWHIVILRIYLKEQKYYVIKDLKLLKI